MRGTILVITIMPEGVNMDNNEVLSTIQAALKSDKVDSYIRHQFYRAQKEASFDPETSLVAFLSQVKSLDRLDTIKPYILGVIGNIIGVQAPWIVVPGIVADENIMNLEASR